MGVLAQLKGSGPLALGGPDIPWPAPGRIVGVIPLIVADGLVLQQGKLDAGQNGHGIGCRSGSYGGARRGRTYGALHDSPFSFFSGRRSYRSSAAACLRT